LNDWFEWNGTRCTEYGIHVTELPPITIPAERVSYTNIPGRAGSLTTIEADDVYDDMILVAQCVIADPAQIPAIAGWLKGAGTVTFANRQGGHYEARIVNHTNLNLKYINNPLSSSDGANSLVGQSANRLT
jgi:phage-related protein